MNETTGRAESVAMLVIFAKLAIQRGDREWIEAVRRAHDPQYRLVEHVTFIFPFSGVPVDILLAHVGKVAEQVAPIGFRLSRATAIRDVFSSGSHVFLLPAEGEEAMRLLHARLYHGVLEQKRHPTAAYLPHVTVGAFARHEEAEQLAASLGPFDIAGILDTICIASHDGASLRELHHVMLGG
jgi:2'-5' RNA ligase